MGRIDRKSDSQFDTALLVEKVRLICKSKNISILNEIYILRLLEEGDWSYEDFFGSETNFIENDQNGISL